jgi:hypothetical protein
MKYGKLSFLALGCASLLALAPIANAQGPEDPMPFHPHGPPNLTIMLTRLLNLSDAQQAQVKPLIADVQPQLDAIHKQAHEQADVIIKQLNEKIRPLLSADQQKRLDAFETLRATQPQTPVAGAPAQ